MAFYFTCVCFIYKFPNNNIVAVIDDHSLFLSSVERLICEVEFFGRCFFKEGARIF